MLRIISDVHQKYNQYIPIAQNSEYSIQLGDMGYRYTDLEELDYRKHKFTIGNHDHHNTVHKVPHFLGRYGFTTLGPLSFFYIGGAFSVDKAFRIKNEPYWGKTWFEEEELSDEEMEDCFNLYKKYKPDVVFSHDCPEQVGKLISNPEVLRGFGFNPALFNTRTQLFLDRCFNFHQPKLQIFGHYHINRTLNYRTCVFAVREELDWIDTDGETFWNSDGSVLCQL